MKIYLHQINDIETEVVLAPEETWIAEAVARLDESDEKDDTTVDSNGFSSPSLSALREQVKKSVTLAPLKTREISGYFQLRQIDEVVVINGEIHTQLNLLCSRCGQGYEHPINTNFSGLYCRDPAMAGVGYLDTKKKFGKNGEEIEGPSRPQGQNHGYARHAHNFAADEERASDLSSKDLDITYISEEYINLADVLTEQIQLQVPFQPLCKEECQGLCLTCGTNLNRGRCACAKLKKNAAFSVLKDLKF